jgi:uncharacterized protein
VIRTLDAEEIERVLRAESVGRIGCHANGRTYVVPVLYLYDEGAIYAHSGYGQKIAMMRQNPLVCFEVDHVEDLVNWTSAICLGTYEELYGERAQEALELLRERMADDLPRTIDHGRLAAEEAAGSEAPVVFRINLSGMTGREERLHWELLPVARTTPRRLTTTSFQSTPAEVWLSHERAEDLAEASGVLDVEDIWSAADSLALNRPVAEITASFTYKGVEPHMAERLATFLDELHDSAPGERKPAGAFIHSSGISEWSDMIPEDVLAERDAEDRGMVSLPSEGGANA